LSPKKRKEKTGPNKTANKGTEEPVMNEDRKTSTNASAYRQRSTLQREKEDENKKSERAKKKSAENVWRGEKQTKGKNDNISSGRAVESKVAHIREGRKKEKDESKCSNTDKNHKDESGNKKKRRAERGSTVRGKGSARLTTTSHDVKVGDRGNSK